VSDKICSFYFYETRSCDEFLSEFELRDLDLSVFQEIKNGITEIRFLFSQELTKKWKEPTNILPEYEIKEMIETLGSFCESKETISKQLKEFISQHKCYEELILSQNQEIKLLKRKFTSNRKSLISVLMILIQGLIQFSISSKTIMTSFLKKSQI
jgi:hypothetical protein